MNGRQIITLLTAGVSAATLSCSQKPTGDLQQALNKLAESSPEENVVMVACYAITMVGEDQVFKCPVCGGKTNHSAIFSSLGNLDKDEDEFSFWARRGMKKFGVTIEVDDSEFCQFCRKKDFADVNKELSDKTVKDEVRPRRAWIISRTDADGKPLPGSPWRIYAKSDDYKILEAFFRGEETVTEQLSTVALNRYIARLAELLKLKAPLRVMRVKFF